ncbi:MAG: phosphotransferase [Magnetococcales bacterium]|nr:phosphotransferase [Magnetococcales bacterium]NGZ05118.1 phosphotransferase [Magnetococcales bacterium]
MGVIKKVLYRGQLLGKPRHRHLFLDMEENIHIHYRDLRIEMSRAEFEEFSEIFRRQSTELQTIIHEKNYQDGKLANANQEDVRIWTESQLKNDVAYHPRRVSIEACSDGYHLHLRNYKFLLDEEDFRQLLRQMQRMDPDIPHAATFSEVLELLEANELDFFLESGNAPAATMMLRVAAHHLPKVRDIFKLIGFTQENTPEGVRYTGAKLTVLVQGEKKESSLDFRALRGLQETMRLVEFLSHAGPGMEANLLNRIKCQVLDLYYALAARESTHVECDPQFWLYSVSAGRVIFPHTPRSVGPDAAKTLYRAWSHLLNRLELSFIKPTKIPLSPTEQTALRTRIDATLQRELWTQPAVERIHLMGSALRAEMGFYLAPFVHGPNAKLGSDVDILIEIHPEREAELPATWHLINPESAASGCAVYHITQLPLALDTHSWSQLHPHIPFMHHLIDAYVYFPSRGNRAAKDAFLKKFGARVVYDRHKDGAPIGSGELAELTRQVRSCYTLPDALLEPLKVSTENLLYKLFHSGGDGILKLFKVAGNYHGTRIAEHTAYENTLIQELVARGVPTARIFPAQTDHPPTLLGFPALLFERLPGTPQSKPEYPLAAIGSALAHLHQVQINAPMDLATAFTFEESCLIWLPYFATYQNHPNLPEPLKPAFADLATRIEPFLDPSFRSSLYADCHLVHNHGDVTPKNVILTPDGLAHFFDFNNCYHGPRLLDLIDGGFEFSLADKYIQLADFTRFDTLLAHYSANSPLNAAETKTLPQWIHLLGTIKFIKEVRVLLERPHEALRRQRALAIAEFLAKRPPSP